MLSKIVVCMINKLEINLHLAKLPWNYSLVLNAKMTEVWIILCHNLSFVVVVKLNTQWRSVNWTEGLYFQLEYGPLPSSLIGSKNASLLFKHPFLLHISSTKVMEFLGFSVMKITNCLDDFARAIISTYLMLWSFITVPHVVMIINHKTIFHFYFTTIALMLLWINM